MLLYKHFFLNTNLQVWERVLGKSLANKGMVSGIAQDSFQYH